MKHLGDITKINGAEIPVVDIITGGSPCQDLSVAGKRAGLQHSYLGDEETTRSGLFMDQLRIVKEMRESDRRKGRHGVDVRPRYMVWENVPGAFSSNGGKDFQAVLTEIARIVEPDAPDVPMPEKGGWPKAGCLYGEMGNWSIAYRVHDAQYWGVPQRRKRIALLADFNGLTAPEILFDPQLRGEAEDSEPDETERNFGTGGRPEVQPLSESLSGDSEPCGETGQETTGATGEGVEGAGVCLTGWDVQSKRIFSPDGKSGTLNSGTTEGMNIVPSVLAFEAISFQERGGKPGGGKGKLIQHEHVGALSTLNNQSVMAFAQNQVGEVRVSSMSGTLNTNSNATGRNSPLVYDARGNGNGVLPFDTTQITSPQNGCNPHYGDPCHPLAAGAHPPAVAIRGEQQPVVAFTQNQRNEVRDLGDVAGALAAEPGVHQQTYVYENHNSQDSRFRPLGDICQTVSATYGMGGNNQPLVVSDAVCVGNGQLNQMSMAEQANTLDDVSETVSAKYGAGGNNQPLVLCSAGEISPNLVASAYKGPGNTQDGMAIVVIDKEAYNCGKSCTGSPQIRVDNVAPTCGADAHPSGVAYNAIVRRLTPLECERLQGYPDGWTDIGDYVDENGRLRKEADTAKYKAAGNSIALPFWAWLFRRINANYERQATMGSLFDGIGGFPLTALRSGIKPLWASEIEAFPIAVCKKHFGDEDAGIDGDVWKYL